MSQRKRNIEFSRPDEPSFLKKLKSQIGFQGNEPDSIDTKKERLNKGNLNDLEDEQPVYVVPEDSDITEQEVDRLKNKIIQENEFNRESDTIKKIIFKKPNDNSLQDDKKMLSFQSTKKDGSTSKNSVLKSKFEMKKAEIKSVKNTSLLSFNDDDEEEDD